MRQRDLRFTFSVLTSPIAFEVVEFTLEEAICETFRLNLQLASHNPSIDFAQILDQPVLLTIWQGSTAVRHVHGLVSSFTQGKTGFRRTRYSLVVEPQLARGLDVLLEIDLAGEKSPIMVRQASVSAPPIDTKVRIDVLGSGVAFAKTG